MSDEHQQDPHIVYRYHDGRVVEAHCSSAHIRIAAGEALPLPDHEATYLSWARRAGHGEIELHAPPPPPEEEKPAEPPKEAAPEEPETKEEERPHATITTSAENQDVPEGYRVEQGGGWHTAYTPASRKIGKSQKSFDAAVLLCRAHAEEARREAKGK